MTEVRIAMMVEFRTLVGQGLGCWEAVKLRGRVCKLREPNTLCQNSIPLKSHRGVRVLYFEVFFRTCGASWLRREVDLNMRSEARQLGLRKRVWPARMSAFQLKS